MTTRCIDERSCSSRPNTIERAKGRWKEILITAGISASVLDGKHRPDPFCGGTDRWRFDDVDGSGSSYCNKCGARSGFTSVALARNLDPKINARQVFQFIEEQIGKTLPTKYLAPAQGKNLKEIASAIWHSSVPINSEGGSLAKFYLLKRGLGLSGIGSVQDLAFHPALRVKFENGSHSFFEALVARVSDEVGDFMGIQRIFLNQAGDKANIPDPKRALGKISGGSVKLDSDIGFELALTEGVETALAVRELSGLPTWACVTAHGLATVKIPEGINRIVIFADRDRSRTGLLAALKLKARLERVGIHVSLEIPKLDIPEGQKSIDFLDVLAAKKFSEGVKK